MKRTKIQWMTLLLLACLGPCLLLSAEKKEASGKQPRGAKEGQVPGSEIFDRPTVVDFQLQLAETNYQALRAEPREYTPATVIVNGRAYHDVGVKLKGAAGSFRSVEDRPAMTLHFSKYFKGQRVFGLRRLHLNNSVQDESRMNEYLGSLLFREAGVPTPRVAWATVRINDRKLGLYVLKEAFESEFLRLYFGSDKGNLYEGGFVRDLDLGMVKESGEGPDDRSDVKALCAAMEEKDATNRWEKLNRLVDVERFVTYAALSVMVADWDGYPMNRNNYRVYFRPSDGRAVFMPHGMDQLFQRTWYELDASWNGSMAWAIFDTPQGMALYQERCRQLFTNVFRLETMTNAITQAAGVLRQVDPNIANAADDQAYKVERRHRNVRRDEFIKPPLVDRPTAAEGPAGKP